MLKKGFLLRKKEDFDRVFRSGKPLFFNEIGCRYLISGRGTARVGFSFSKKHLPLAIDRNRLRRILSEAFFQLKNEWPEGVDMVFFSTRKPKNVSFEEGRLLLQKLFSRIKKPEKI